MQQIESIINTLNAFSPIIIIAIIVIVPFIQIVFPPIPNDLLVLCVPIVFVNNILFSILLLAIYASSTAFTHFLLFSLGYKRGYRILKNKYVLRIFPQEIQDRAKLYVKEKNFVNLILWKFIPAVYSIIILFCGMSQYPKNKAYLAISIGCAIQSTCYFLIGLLMGNNLEKLVAFLNEAKIIFIIGIAIIIFIMIIKYFYKKRKAMK